MRHRRLQRAEECVQTSKRDRGQALVELPYVIVIVCVLILLTLQPVVYLYTQMALGQIASGLCRIVATEEAAGSSRDLLLRSYAADKLEGLPRGKAFWVPGTLRIAVSGDATSEVIEVQVTVKQEPLPLTGLLLGAGINQDLEVTGRAVTTGARYGVLGTPQDAPQHFGFVSP
ncbi:MAG: hypothetical protein FWF11_00645 [Coriobacteriia bacterium]|nr:hypothetical protein [Coriobacteriia bacterium]